MNVNQLQPPPQPQLHRFSRDALHQDADLLSLKLLNRRARLRLSPQPIPLDDLPPTTRLFAVANSKRWFVAAVRSPDNSYALSLSPLADLRAAFTPTSSDGPLTLNPTTTISLQHRTPHILVVTRDDSRILVAFTDGAISVFDWSTPTPLFTFPSSGPKTIKGIFPSTGESHIAAVLREQGDHPAVQLLDAHNMVSIGAWNGGGSPGTNPTSVSWSPKGKQIAIGLENGDVVTFSPSDTSAVKTVVPHPSSVNGQSLISLQWLSNTEFHGIYAAANSLAPDTEQTHFILSLEAKASRAGDIKLTTPYLPFPGLRPPGSFTVTLRNWEPYRFLLFVGDSTSSDVGLIGSLTSQNTSLADSWYNLALEEDSTPSVPLDTDLNETVLLGLDLDVTSTELFRFTGVSGEATDVPAPPIMYLYASDGTLTGWNIIQTQGVPYPDMSIPATPVPSPSAAVAIPTAQSEPFGTPQSAFRTSPTATGTNAFSSASLQNAAAAPSSGSTFGFSAFSGAPSAFSNTSFGFGQQSQPQESKAPSPPQAPPLSAPTMSVEMTSATDDSMASETESGFGGLSLGGSGGGEAKLGTTNSMFGTFGNATQQAAFGGGGPVASSTFATFGSGPVKPPVGFGAFASTGSSAFGTSSGFSSSAFGSGVGPFSSGASNAGSGAFSTTQPTPAENKPASAFGQSGFAASSAKPAFGQSGFGQSSFGQSSAFGKSAFGSSSFGSSIASSQPTTTSTFGSGASSGGFAAFASQGTSSFGATAQRSTDSKPVWAQNASQEKPQESTSSTPTAFDGPSAVTNLLPSKAAESAPAGGAFAGLAQSNQSATGGSVFGKTTFGQSSFGQTLFGQSGAPSEASTTSTNAGTLGSGGAFGRFANTNPSAFGTTTSPAKDARPAWATAPTDTASEKQPRSAFGFGTSVTTSSAFGGTSSAPSVVADSAIPSSSPEKPAPLVSTPPATPPVKSPGTTETATPATTTPTSTTTPSTTPTGGGAFGGLKTSSTGFSGLQLGFGAFGGGNTAPSSSPFFQKPGAVSTSPASAFGSATAGALETTPQSKGAISAAKFGAPTFGTSSLPSTGFFGKSPTSTTPTTPATPPNVAAKSAFSAFSGSSSPFGAVPGSSGKSFGEMLRQKEGERSEDGKKDEGFSRTADEWKRPVSVFAQLKEAAAETGKDGEDKDAEGEEDGPGDTSFRSLEDGSEGEDALDDFLKSDEEDLPSEEGDEEEEEEEEGEAGGSELPPVPPPSESLATKLPVQKASSVFGISFTPASPTKHEQNGEPSKPTFTRAASTTPPGSPATERGSAPVISRAASAPPAGAPGLTPALLGVGRPSTRPTRSSPLANRPISGDDEGEEEDEPPRSPLEMKKARSASPAVPVSAAPTSRPKTPPVLFGAATAPPKVAPFVLSAAASPVTKSSDGGDTGKGRLSGPAARGNGVVSTLVSQGGLLEPQSLGSAFPSSVTPTAPPATTSVQTSLFGQKLSIPTPGSIFSSQITKAGSPAPTSPLPAASPSPFALATPASTQSSQSARWPQAGATPTSTPESPAQSMLTEFTHLYNTLTRELDDLKALAAQASFRTMQLQKPSGSAKVADDLNEPTKWVMSDLAEFKRILKEPELGLEKWEKEKATCILHLRELESDMLKGSTREEEVERFSKASKDAEFARMLKQRTLSPDHLETQTQLRRDIRAIRGRIQQLEEYIQASKKKLSSVKNGKPSFKPPSLDTINRTYRNIDAAIDHEEDDLAQLTERVAQLELSSQAAPILSFSASVRDRRLPDRNSQRVGREVTPNIAASTAAALNAERSAQKLKKALLSARKQPLLNNKAVDAVPRERQGEAQKTFPDSGLNPGAAFTAGLNGGFPAPASGSGPRTPQWSAPAGWSLPPFDSSASPTAGLGGGRSRGQREKQHARPIQLHQGAKAPPPPPPAGFSWGPVPTIQPKTTISILAGFESIKGKGKEENGLGGSWVADDFEE